MLGYNGTLFTMSGAGPTLTAAAAASMLVAATPAAGQIRAPVSALTLRVGTMFRFKARGFISTAITTPGTARFDIRLGGVIAWDSQAIPLVTAAATTNVWWKLEVECVVRQEGVTNMGLLWGQGEWLSSANINVPIPATGPGPGGVLLPYGTAAGLSGTLTNTAGFDTSIPNVFDSFFTQTVTTGSMTCQMAELTVLN